MFSRIRSRFGTAGLIVSIIALVAALAGGAYAAQNGLNGKQKKEVKKIARAEAKKFPGEPGTPGAPGAVGPAGPAGANGKDGAAGAPGAAGKSVTIGTPTVGECENGGATVQVEGSPGTKKAVCNGKDAALPATMTGTWSVGVAAEGPLEFSSISFPVALDEEPELVFLKEGEAEPTKCPGAPAEPEAAPGVLCVYTELEEGISLNELTNVYSTGAVLSIAVAAGSFGYGTWAVTAE